MAWVHTRQKMKVGYHGTLYFIHMKLIHHGRSLLDEAPTRKHVDFGKRGILPFTHKSFLRGIEACLYSCPLQYIPNSNASNTSLSITHPGRHRPHPSPLVTGWFLSQCPHSLRIFSSSLLPWHRRPLEPLVDIVQFSLPPFSALLYLSSRGSSFLPTMGP